MKYSELQKIIVEKYQVLNEVNTKILALLMQKNKIDVDLSVLQIQRQSLMEEVKQIENNKVNELLDYIKIAETKPSIKSEKKLKDKSEISMQPTIVHE